MEKNETQAYEYFKKAAQHNNSIAFNALAFIELSHHNNRSGAVYHWKKAADLGDADGLNNYAFLLETGLNPGDPQNHVSEWISSLSISGRRGRGLLHLHCTWTNINMLGLKGHEKGFPSITYFVLIRFSSWGHLLNSLVFWNNIEQYW